MIITFDALGTPITQGSMRRGSRGQVFHDNPRLKTWRAIIEAAALDALFRTTPAERVLLQEPDTAVEVVCGFRLARPKTVRRSWPTRRHDIDKLVRALLDGITSSGLWADDGQVCRVTASKRYCEAGEPPGVQVAVRVIA